MSDPSTRTAVAADAEGCLAALTSAFSSDPPCRWAWPDPQQYLEAHSAAGPLLMEPSAWI